MWADDLAATFRSFDIFRKLASTILDECPEVNRGAPGFTGGLQVLRGFCYTL
jgi:hypothetical protein